MKTLINWPLSLALACALTGCSKHAADDSSDGVIRLNFWHAMGGKLLPVLDDLIAEFNAEHPGIEVRGINQGNYPALSQKLMAAVAAKNPPDLAQAYESWTTQLIRNDVVVSLSPYIEASLDSTDLADIYPIFIEGNTWDGEVWSFPFNKSVMSLYYNVDLFEREGLTPPTDWPSWRAVTQTLTVDEDGDGRPERYGTAGNVSARLFCTLVFQNGGRVIAADGSHMEYASPMGIEALDFYRWLVGTKHSRVGYLSAGFEHQNDFLAGKVGMILETSVSLVFMEGKANFQMGLAPIPTGRESGNVIAGTNVVIFDSGQEARHQAAWQFIQWFSETPQTAQWAAGTGYCPVRRSALNHPRLLERFRAHPTLRTVFDQIDDGRLEPTETAWVEGRPWLEEEAIESVLRGLAEPEPALKAVARRTDVLLAKERG